MILKFPAVHKIETEQHWCFEEESITLSERSADIMLTRERAVKKIRLNILSANEVMTKSFPEKIVRFSLDSWFQVVYFDIIDLITRSAPSNHVLEEKW